MPVRGRTASVLMAIFWCIGLIVVAATSKSKTATSTGISTRVVILVAAGVYIVMFYSRAYGKIAKIYKRRIAYFRSQGVAGNLENDFASGVRMFDGNLVVGQYFMFGKRTGMIVMFGEIGCLYRNMIVTNYKSGDVPKTDYELNFYAGNKPYHLCNINGDSINAIDWNNLCNYVMQKNPSIRIEQRTGVRRKTVDDTGSDD